MQKWAGLSSCILGRYAVNSAFATMSMHATPRSAQRLHQKLTVLLGTRLKAIISDWTETVKNFAKFASPDLIMDGSDN